MFLLFASQFTQDNFVVVTVHPMGQVIYGFYIGSPFFKGRCEDHLYLVSSSRPSTFHVFSSSLWYSCLDHRSSEVLSKLSLGFISILNKAFCKPYALSKSHKVPFNSNKITSFSHYLIYSDLWTSSTLSLSPVFSYYVLFSVDYSRYSWIFPMRAKTEVFMHFESLYNMVTSIFNSFIKFLQTNDDMEYVNHSFKTFCHKTKSVHRVSYNYTPEQNGLDERKYRDISIVTYLLLNIVHTQSNNWVKVALIATFIINLLLCSVVSSSSLYFQSSLSSPNLSFLLMFSCAYHSHLGVYTSKKLESRSIECL